LAKISTGNKDLFIATQNKDSVKIFSRINAIPLSDFTPAALDTWAVLEFNNGTKEKVEFYYGTGYLSQSSRKMRIPSGVAKMTVYDSKGKSRTIELKKPI
jgi:hypothetical protein